MTSKPRTHLIVLVDESISMTGVASGVRTGINAYLDEAAGSDRQYLTTVATFSEDRRVLCRGVDVAQATRLTAETYRPNGNTAMLDAIGQTISEHLVLGDHAPDDRVLLVLATDGADNCSQRYSPGDVLHLVRQQEQQGWTFIHLAAGSDTVQESVNLGLGTVIAIAQADLAREAMYHSVARATDAWAAGGDARSAAAIITADLGQRGSAAVATLQDEQARIREVLGDERFAETQAFLADAQQASATSGGQP